MYRIFLTNEFLKQLDKIRLPIRKHLDKKISGYLFPQLKQEPHFGKNIKKLRGYEPERWRYRIGDFRLFYFIDSVTSHIKLTRYSYNRLMFCKKG